MERGKVRVEITEEDADLLNNDEYKRRIDAGLDEFAGLVLKNMIADAKLQCLPEPGLNDAKKAVLLWSRKESYD